MGFMRGPLFEQFKRWLVLPAMHHTLLSISFHGEQYKFLEYTENVVLAKKQKTTKIVAILLGLNEKSVVFFFYF